MGFDFWEECRIQAMVHYGLEEYPKEDQIYSSHLSGAPEKISIGQQLSVIRSTVPREVPVSLALDSLFHHTQGPSMANITELNGPRGIGKTIYCMNVVKRVLEMNEEALVLWIYTRADLRTEDFVRMGCDLERILCIGAFSAPDLFLALDRASHFRTIRLVVIDNIALPFLNTDDARRVLRRFGVKLRTLVSLNPAIGLVTNYCYEDEWMPPMLGDVWSEQVDQRIQMFYKKEQNNNNQRIACLSKCFDKGDGCRTYKDKCTFSINTDDLSINSQKL